MILEEFLDLTNLSKASNFYIHNIAEVVMICENKNFVFATFQIMLPCLESFDNSKKLAIMSFMLSFYENYFSKKKTIGCYQPKSLLVTTPSRLVPNVY